MDNRLQDTIDSLDDLLDEERLALLGGNLDLIGRMVARKESLIDVLNDYGKADKEVLSTLNDKVLRNQNLLGSALEGIQSVADRLAAMRRIKISLDTYDSRGNRKKIEMTLKGSVEKRA